jgi:hypothetical protein
MVLPFVDYGVDPSPEVGRRLPRSTGMGKTPDKKGNDEDANQVPDS